MSGEGSGCVSASNSPSVTVETLVESLRDITDNIERHIEQRAREIADPWIKNAHDESTSRVEEMHGELRAQKQRADDLLAEMRRQSRARDQAFRKEVEARIADLRDLSKLAEWSGEQVRADRARQDIKRLERVARSLRAEEEAVDVT